MQPHVGGTVALGLHPELWELGPAGLWLGGILSEAKSFNGDMSENPFALELLYPHEAKQGSHCNRPRKAFPFRSIT